MECLSPLLSVVVLGDNQVDKKSLLSALGVKFQRQISKANGLNLDNQRFMMFSEDHDDSICNNLLSGGLVLNDFALIIVSVNEKPWDNLSDLHKQLVRARMLGISKLVVAITKMHLIGWNHAHYLEFLTHLSHFFERVHGYAFVDSSNLANDNIRAAFHAEVQAALSISDMILPLCELVMEYVGLRSMPNGAVFCPIACPPQPFSHMVDIVDFDAPKRSQNVLCEYDSSTWYKGPCLQKVLSCCGSTISKQHLNGLKSPLRLCVLDIKRWNGISYPDMPNQTIVIVRVLQGCVRVGEEVYDNGARHLCLEISSFPRFEPIEFAGTGDIVMLMLSNSDASIPKSVLCHPNLLAKKELIVQLRFANRLKYKSIITAGFVCELAVHVIVERCEIVELMVALQVDSESKRLVKERKKPVFFRAGSRGIVKIALESAVVIEPYSSCARLGFLIMLDGEQIIGTGKVLAVSQVP